MAMHDAALHSSFSRRISHDAGDGATRVHLVTAPLLALLLATSACTAHELLAAECCIARTATTTSTAHLPWLQDQRFSRFQNEFLYHLAA